jgi:tetratricopeptide (TPR) repeat protein
MTVYLLSERTLIAVVVKTNEQFFKLSPDYIMQRRILNIILGNIFLLLALCTPAFAQKPTPAVQAQVVKLMQEGVTKQNKGEFNEALALYTKAYQLSPQDAQILSFRARLYAFALNNPRAAIEDATKALSLNSKLQDVYFVRGASYLNTQRLVEAERDLERSTQLGAKDFYPYKILGITQALLQKYDKAIEAFTQAVKLAPKEGSLYYERANALSNLRKYRESIPDYDMAIQYEPNDMNAYVNRASSRTAIQDYSGAVRDYSVLIEKYPKNILYWINRGTTYSESRDYARAIEDLTQALVLDSTMHRARLFRARTYLENSAPALAVQDCSTLLRLNPQDQYAFANGGSAVSAYLQRDNFINGDVYAIRASARFVMGDTLGACNDAGKAIDLGSQNGSKLSIGICQRQNFIASPLFPKSYQLYARNSRDSATIPLIATLSLAGYDSVYALLRKNDVIVSRIAQKLNYLGITQSGSSSSTLQAQVNLSLNIHAELSQYQIVLGAKNVNKDTILAVRDSIVCGDAFLVSGQSNVVLGEVPSTVLYPFVRTFTVSTKDAYWGVATAKPNDDYSIGGTAYQFASQVSQQQNIPVALINGGLSGSTIEQHFRDNNNLTNPMSWYGRMLWRVREAGLANAAKAMIWYQGESNENATYGDKFTTLHTAWKQDYPNLNNVYVVQVRPSECSQSPITSPREEQRLLGSRLKDVEVIAASGLPAHDGCHYGNEGYITLGKQIFNLINRDIYKATDTIGISSPNLIKAAWTGAKRNEIALTFATNDALVCGADTNIVGKIRTLANDAFLLDGKPVKAVSVRSEKNVVVVKLASASAAKTMSYVPEKCYAASADAPCVVYEGPWITTARGIGALTFTNVVIQTIP